jgi:hypothetical protein
MKSYVDIRVVVIKILKSCFQIVNIICKSLITKWNWCFKQKGILKSFFENEKNYICESKI